MNQRERLAALLRTEPLILLPTCGDPFTGRIIERLGFKAAGLSGNTFGTGDGITEPLTTMTEIVSASRAIARSINIPLIADGGAGFGEPLHCMRLVRELEWAGVAGLHIDDQIYPKRAHYHRDYREHVISLEGFTDKIRMAVQARQDPNLLIVARTDAMKTDGYEEGMRRLHAAVAAGAGAVMCFPNTRAEMERVPKDIQAPAFYVNTWGNRVGRPILRAEEAKQWGYKFLIDAMALVEVTYRAVKDVFTHLRDDGLVNVTNEEAIQLRAEIEELLDLPAHYAVEEQTVERGH